MTALGRRAPRDFAHVDRYPLTLETAPRRPTPVVIGVNWYENFDTPQDKWIGRGELGAVRGGHCVCLLPRGVSDPLAWWTFYNQGAEGACVGFGCSRMMSLLNRYRYDARWLWDEAKRVDEWPETNPGDDNGTSVRAALDVLRTQGHRRVRKNGSTPPGLADGIARNRWAATADEALQVLGTPERDYVTVLNSWGRDFPHKVRMPAETLDRLIREDGEVGLVTDR